MTRQVLYVAAPLAPTEEEIANAGRFIPDDATPQERAFAMGFSVRANLQRALRWLAWLRKSFPETTFIAPWIATVMSLDGDDSPELREAGLVDDCAVVERCDGIVLCGGRISSGMRREMEHGKARGGPLRIADQLGYAEEFQVYDLSEIDEATRDRGTWLGGESRCPTSWNIWAECFRDDGEPEGLGR